MLRPWMVGFLLVAGATACWGQNVRFYTENGVTYRETRKRIRYPVTETHTEKREQTVYRKKVTTETKKEVRTQYIPVQKWCWQTRWVGRWNPFVQPYPTQELVPCRTWEQRRYEVEVPVTKIEYEPEKRVVKVPVTRHRMAEREVVQRVPVSTAPAAPSRIVTTPRPPAGSRADGSVAIGGIARLENDPPRYGAGSGWRPATIRR